MPHVDGVDDDGAGYGVSGYSENIGMIGRSNRSVGTAD